MHDETRVAWLAFGWITAGCPEARSSLQKDALDLLEAALGLSSRASALENAKAVRAQLERSRIESANIALSYQGHSFSHVQFQRPSGEHLHDRARWIEFALDLNPTGDDLPSYAWTQATRAAFAGDEFLSLASSGNHLYGLQYARLLSNATNGNWAGLRNPPPEVTEEGPVPHTAIQLSRDIALAGSRIQLDETLLAGWINRRSLEYRIKDIETMLSHPGVRADGYALAWHQPTAFLGQHIPFVELLGWNENPLLAAGCVAFSSALTGTICAIDQRSGFIGGFIACDCGQPLSFTDDHLSRDFVDSYLSRSAHSHSHPQRVQVARWAYEQRAWRSHFAEHEDYPAFEGAVRESGEVDLVQAVEIVRSARSDDGNAERPAHDWLRDS